jgi:NADPH2:quinone reductase
MIGLVDKLREGVTKFKIGQKVADLTVIGAYSEYICLPKNRLALVPDELDPTEAVSTEKTSGLVLRGFDQIIRFVKLKQDQTICW